jgi:hypothetical protein
LGRAVLTAGFVGALALTAGCPEEKPEEPKEEPKPEEPKKPEIPEYAPTGDHADIKKEAAKDITADNAMDKAKELDSALDGELKKLEGGDEEGGEEKPAD